MRLKDVMSTAVQTVRPSESLERARMRMRERGIHHLVVVDNRRVVGVVSDEALQRAIAEGVARVEDAMVRHLVTASPNTSVRQAAGIMRGRIGGALPVVEDQKLVGIVTVSDLLDLIARGLERPDQTTRRRLPPQRSAQRPSTPAARAGRHS